MVEVLRGNVVLPDCILERGAIVLEQGRIVAVDDGEQYPHEDGADFSQCYLLPGLVDVHTHGIAGSDTMDATPEAIARLASRYAAHGVTGFLPTTVTQDFALTMRAVRCIRAYTEAQEVTPHDGALVLGLHLEGPWLAPAFKGAQNEDYLLAPDLTVVRRLLSEGGEAVRIVTIAPELPGAGDTIAYLRSQGVAVSIGHTAATYDEMLAAIARGASQVTHCFNGMPVLHHRQPGPVGAALLHAELTTELIADCVHVHPATMRLLIRMKGREHVMLVTDSMSATELADGLYDLGGQAVTVKNGEARLASGALAGSTLTLERAVANLVRACGISLPDAVFMASTVPASAIGFGDRKGRLAPGFDADICVLDLGLRPLCTIVGGHRAWQAVQ